MKEVGLTPSFSTHGCIRERVRMAKYWVVGADRWGVNTEMSCPTFEEWLRAAESFVLGYLQTTDGG